MSTGEWERVRALFQATLEQPEATRELFLSTACNQDEGLRREVRSLLDAHAAADGFLETPAVQLDARPPAAAAATLRPGDRVGSFEVRGSLGAGGMGEVYRAHDSQLGRDVAIKLLPPAFAADPQRLTRFERESRILASLNHPNIAALHNIERIDGLRLLVLELVEGPTLADRLKNGPVPVSDALAIARQLTDALEAAHERGIVHRDLKPANVKLSPSQGVKLLDFGLAKEQASQAGPETSAGLILGTCAYMSPEQARGRPVDKRADIWAFGCILFELLTGRRAFPGDTSSDTIAAVLKREPEWSALPKALPLGVLLLLRRCLEKDPHWRLHDIADARIEVEHAGKQGESSHFEPSSGSWMSSTLARIAAAALLVIGGATLGWWGRDTFVTVPAAARAMRSTWSVPAGMRLESPPVVSPDGQHIAFTASAAGAPPRLYVRPLRALDAQPVLRTDGAMKPFWSPDSGTVGFFARGKLMKVAIDGGPPVEICATVAFAGGAWSRNGVIVFSPGEIYSGLLRVSANGGIAEAATLIDSAQRDNAHRWPVFLPDGIHFVYFVRSINAERRGVYVARVDRPASTPGTALFRSESEAVYAALDGERGVLLSVAAGHIDVRPFDARRQVVTGDPTSLPLPTAGNTPRDGAMLSVSAEVLTHVSLPMPYGQRLISSARTGDDHRVHTNRGIVNWPRLSRDGSRLVSQQLDPITGSPDLWVEHLERGTRVRVTEEGTSGQLAVWSPDGNKLAYVAGPPQKPVLTIAAADGTGVISTLPCPGFRCEPSDWSREGQWLLVTALEGKGADVWMLSTEPGGARRPLLTDSFVERDARFSPDGQLVAYVSQETGRPEISVRTIDGTPRREVVSVGGGTQPVWSKDGTELLFVDPDGSLRSAAIRRSAGGRPVVVSATRVDIQPIGTGHYGTQYDLSPDGRRIFFLDRQLPEAPRDVGIVVGWRELLK